MNKIKFNRRQRRMMEAASRKKVSTPDFPKEVSINRFMEYRLLPAVRKSIRDN